MTIDRTQKMHAAIAIVTALTPMVSQVGLRTATGRPGHEDEEDHIQRIDLLNGIERTLYNAAIDFLTKCFQEN